jgi:hypothetical protein
VKRNGLKLKTVGDVTYVFDITRKKYLVLTPEEKVRQTFIHYLLDVLGYSLSLLRTELPTLYHGLAKRTDILVFDQKGQPYMLVECKAADVKISSKVVEQASRYNLSLQAPYLCVTNGSSTFCFHIDFENQKITQIRELPLPQV